MSARRRPGVTKCWKRARAGAARSAWTSAEIADRSAAEALRGAGVWIESVQLAVLPAGEYWAFQLIGCEVEDGAGRSIGRVREIRGTGAQDILVVDGAGGAEHLIPAVREWWREVDLARRRIVVELPPGLLEPARRRSG